MSADRKGKVKEKVWLRPTCTDDSEPLGNARLARKDFNQHCRGEGPVDVTSPDTVGEAFEETDPYAEGRDDLAA
jgi:hypothetical protein